MTKKHFLPIFSILLLTLLLCACAAPELSAPAPTPTPDPYAGLVRVADGAGGETWVRLYDELPAMALSAADFAPRGSYIEYTGTQAEALRGIDVSEHQGNIDWAAVAADGVAFAMIRAGYRGSEVGLLNEDDFFRANIEGALENGLRVGVYFFSQATTATEALEEAEFLLGLIDGYDLTLPVCFDWEPFVSLNARTNGVSGDTVTDCALVFAGTVRAAGYTPGVYFYRDLGYRFYALDRLKDLVFWAGAPGDAPDFYYAHALWQYSYTARIPGIETDCDLDLYFLVPEAPASETDVPAE